jgi:peptide/nickel transport system substrate-binding protein
MTFSSFITRRTALKLAGATALSATLAFGAMAQDAPVTGGTLVYLEQQAHTNLYPPSGGFYPNSGILNQITDKLTWQNPKTLAVEPWIAESWEVSDDAKVYTFKIRPGVTFSDGTPVDAASVAKNFDTYGLGNKELGYPVSEVINNYDHSEVVDDLLFQGFGAGFPVGHGGDRLRAGFAGDARVAVQRPGRCNQDRWVGRFHRRQRNAWAEPDAEGA